MNLLLVFLGVPAAAYRLTRLITKDTFPPVLWLRDRIAGGYRRPTRAEQYHPVYPQGQLSPGTHTAVPGLRGLWSLDEDGDVRVFISHWKHSPHWLAELITCPWCASAYVSAAVTAYAAVLGWLPWPDAPIIWLYAWSLASVTASKEWA